MNWLTGLSPATVFWIALVACLVGGVAGGSIVWTVQGYRIDAVQAKYDGFVATTAALGKSAKEDADRKVAAGKLKKEQSDNENQTTITTLRTDNERLRKSRSGGGFVPAATAGTRRPDLACFDRAELESAIRIFDIGVQGLVDEGSETAVNLNTAKRWAQVP